MKRIIYEGVDITDYSLDDLGFIGDPSYEFTDKDRVFLRKFFADRKASRAKEYTATPQVAYA